MTEGDVLAGASNIGYVLMLGAMVLGGVFGLLKWFANRMLSEIEARLLRIESLESRFEQMLVELPLNYQRREDAIREYTTINVRLDRLVEVLIDIRGAMNAKSN